MVMVVVPKKKGERKLTARRAARGAAARRGSAGSARLAVAAAQAVRLDAMRRAIVWFCFLLLVRGGSERQLSFAWCVPTSA